MASVEMRVIRQWLRSPPKPRGAQADRQRPAGGRVVHDLLVVGAEQVLDARQEVELASGPMAKALRDRNVDTRPGWQDHRCRGKRREVAIIALAGPGQEESSSRISRHVVL